MFYHMITLKQWKISIRLFEPYNVGFTENIDIFKIFYFSYKKVVLHKNSKIIFSYLNKRMFGLVYILQNKLGLKIYLDSLNYNLGDWNRSN